MMNWIRLLVLTILVLGSGAACALFGGRRMAPVASRQQVFFAPYDEVERAVQRALTRYPPKVASSEAGIFETDWVKDDLRFRPAHSEEDFSSGYRYRLSIRLIKGKSISKPAVKVVIIKNAVLQRDFFAEEETVPSDGLEETAILYRVSRGIHIERALRRSEKSEKSEK